ncbi:MAG: hypothetical protein KAU06_01225 [Candidatus Marinimicrobia bacterium]|nr:hypothetical protein [Candidatus Neomarinimicrobiota bacterium]
MANTFTQLYIHIIFNTKGREKHHRKKTFKEEYLEFLEKFGIVEVVGFCYK